MQHLFCFSMNFFFASPKKDRHAKAVSASLKIETG